MTGRAAGPEFGIEAASPVASRGVAKALAHEAHNTLAARLAADLRSRASWRPT